jgi:nucleoside-diphosphate-sugar epimerase
MGNSLLIIGGTGFFGKSILDSFKRGLLTDFNVSKIIVLSRNIDQFKINYPELCFKGVELLNGDISIIESIPYADFVIHAATSTMMNDYKDISNNLGKNNTERSITNYCNIAHNYHYKSKILYCSSGAVYGKQPLNIEKLDEDFPFLQNLSDLSIEKQNYCLGKRFAEKEIINLGKSGLSVSIARCFAFSGKYLPRDQHYAYGNFIGQAEKGEDITVKTNGIVYRSYLEADDLVISLMKILQLSSTTCPIFNVGSDRQTSLYDLAKTIAMKYSVNCEFENYNDSVVIDRYVPNTDKLKKI